MIDIIIQVVYIVSAITGTIASMIAIIDHFNKK